MTSISERTKLDLLASKDGNVVLLHLGALEQEYIWAQYDSITRNLQFISSAGEIHDLGLAIPAKMDKFLSEATEIMLVELDQSYIPSGDPVLVKFIYGDAYASW